MNVPGCCSIPVVPCAMPVLPVMGNGDSNCASPLLYLPLPSCSHWHLGGVFLHKHLYVLCGTSLKGTFLNTSDVCGSTRTFKLWLVEAGVPIVLIAELQSVAVKEKFWLSIIKAHHRSTSILHYYCEDNGGPGRVSVISVAFMKNVHYQCLTFPANGSN